jgi:hypothetical protein
MTLETFIENLNGLAFFGEFTFSETKFKPAGGTELELADNIVWMADDLTVLQLKERNEADVKDLESETRWFTKVVLGKATKQIRDTLRYLEENAAIKITNGRGHSFELRKVDIKSTTKIVVYSPGSIVPAVARNTTHYVSSTGGFIHVLHAGDYLEVCRTLRVPADIRDYFAYRQRALEEHSDLKVGEPLLMGQYLSGDEQTPPSKESYRFLEALKQNAEEFDISAILANIHRNIEITKEPNDYYRILQQFTRLPRSGWKEAKTRFIYALEAVQKGIFRVPVRFSLCDCGYVFIPMDPELMKRDDAAHLREAGLVNLTIAHKYEQHLPRCVGVHFAKDGADILIHWCLIEHPWEYDDVLENKLKESSPFLEVKQRVLPRYEFK